MAVNTKHYLPNGKLWTGKTHKDAKGRVMSGATHTATSKYLTHTKSRKKA